MIRKIFVENNNDERTNIIRSILDFDRIPYLTIKEATKKGAPT